METAFVCGLRNWIPRESQRDGDAPGKPGPVAATPHAEPSRRAGLARLPSHFAHAEAPKPGKPGSTAARFSVTLARRRRLPALALFAIAMLCALDAGYIHAKAALAQALLERAFVHRAETGETVKPWPWADTVPVARLTVPGHAIERIVLAGDSGRALAFGPGWSPASAAPGGHGTTIVSGHRDTHFSFLQALADGDEVQLQTPDGTLARYRIAERFVADSRTQRIAPAADADELWLVTCWPFDAIAPGGPLRFVARAVAL